MKKIFTLSALLLSCLLASAQVCTEKPLDPSRVIVGIPEANSPAVQAGLHNARYDVQANQIALVAGEACVSAYYVVYEGSRVVACGKFAKVKAGEIEIVKVGRPAEKCRVVVSDSPLIAHKQ